MNKLVSQEDRALTDSLARQIVEYYYGCESSPDRRLQPLIISDQIPVDVDCRASANLVMGVNPGQPRPTKGLIPNWYIELNGVIAKNRLDDAIVNLACELDHRFSELRERASSTSSGPGVRVLLTVITRDSNIQLRVGRAGIPSSSTTYLSEAVPPIRRSLLRSPLIAVKLGGSNKLVELDQLLVSEIESSDDEWVYSSLEHSTARSLPNCLRYQVPAGWTAQDFADYIGITISGDQVSIRTDHWYAQTRPRTQKSDGCILEFGIKYPGLGKLGLDLDAGKVYLTGQNEAPAVTKVNVPVPVLGFSFTDKLVLTGGKMPSGRAVSCFFFPEVSKDDPVEYRHNGVRLWSFSGEMPEIPEDVNPVPVPESIVGILSAVSRFYPRAVEVTEEAFDNFLTLPRMSTFSGTASECSSVYRLTSSVPISPQLVDRLLRSRAATGRPIGRNPSVKVIRIQDTPTIYRIQPIPSDLGRIADALEAISAKWDRYAPMPEESEEKFSVQDAMRWFTEGNSRPAETADHAPVSKPAEPEEPRGLTFDTDILLNAMGGENESDGCSSGPDWSDAEDEPGPKTVDLKAPDAGSFPGSPERPSALIPVVSEDVNRFLPAKSVRIDETRNRVSFLAEPRDAVPRVDYYMPGMVLEKVQKAYDGLSPKKGATNQLWNDLADHFTMRNRLRGDLMRELDDISL